MTVPLPLAADFGPLVIAHDVDQFVIAKLKLWLPTHLARVEFDRADLDAGYLARPRPEAYSVEILEVWPDHRLPSILVQTSGVQGEPQTNGDGTYNATWAVDVTALVRSFTPPETRRNASLYEGAVRRVMLQRDSTQLGRLRWIGTDAIRPVQNETDEGRYMAAVTGHYVCEVENVARLGAGPAVPGDPYATPDPVNTPDLPYGDLVTVSGVLINVNGDTPSQQIGG